MFGDFTINYSKKAALVMVIIGLALASCRSEVAVEKELAEPTHTVTLPSAPPTATPSAGLISLPPLDTDRPADILQEIAYFTQGGGGGAACSQPSSENRQQHSPYVANQGPQESVDWLDYYALVTCEWTPGERVTVSLFFNDERLDFGGEVFADEWGSVGAELVFSRDYPPGIYEFIVNGTSDRFSHSVQVNEPHGPTLYHLFDSNKQDTGELLLVGFQPGERIRIVMYSGIGQAGYRPFAGWTTVQAGSDGQLIVISPYIGGDGTNYAAVGDLSGEAKGILAFAAMGLKESGSPATCPGAFPTRLTVGDVARVVADRLSVREGPGTNYSTIYGTSISNGRTVTILGGPICSEGMLWWMGETGLITLTNGEQHNITGWMAEESGDEWLLEPVP